MVDQRPVHSAQPGWALWFGRIVTQAVCTVILQQIIVASGLLSPFTTWAGGWVGDHVALTGWMLAFVVGVPVTAVVTTWVTRLINRAPTSIVSLTAAHVPQPVQPGGESRADPHTGRPISEENLRGLVTAIEHAAEAIGRAVGSGATFWYDEAVASIAPMFRLIENEGIAIPELRKDGPKLGALRAHRYIQLVVRPCFLIGDEAGALKVAAEAVPGINAMSERELMAYYDGVVKRPAPKRDMTLRDALRHFAYKSRWAHEFEHPTGDWMTVVRWPQAVHREFCQPLIDDALIAWGIRRDPGKPPENGHTKIADEFWRTAQFEVEYALEDPERTGWAKDVQGVIYSRIELNRAQVEAHWPAVESGEVSPIETAAKAWWALRSEAVADSRAQMAEQVERAQAARQAAAEKMADPYRQAVLRLEGVPVTKMSNGEYLTKVECHLRLTSRVALHKCCVWISELRERETVPIDAFCRTGRNPDKTFKSDFFVAGGHVQPVALIKRDLADIVSNPPFLLLTTKGEYPLADNSEYLLRLELRSEAKYPTLVDLKIVTGVKEALDVSIASETV